MNQPSQDLSQQRNRIDEIELSNRKIISVLNGADREKVKKYLKENKVKVRDLQDLKAIVALLNS